MHSKTARISTPRLVAIGLAAFLAGFVPESGLAGEKTTVLGVMDAGKPRGVLRTLDGRMFVGVREARADPDGLTFRHDGGAARVSRPHLTAADQTRFALPAPPPSATAAPDAKPFAWAGSTPLTLTFQTWTVLPPPVVIEAGGDDGCCQELRRFYWPPYWGRPHYGHAYANFGCRQLAERDFLITTGLIPRPPGVRTWRLR